MKEKRYKERERESEREHSKIESKSKNNNLAKMGLNWIRKDRCTERRKEKGNQERKKERRKERETKRKKKRKKERKDGIRNMDVNCLGNQALFFICTRWKILLTWLELGLGHQFF